MLSCIEIYYFVTHTYAHTHSHTNLKGESLDIYTVHRGSELLNKIPRARGGLPPVCYWSGRETMEASKTMHALLITVGFPQTRR